MIKVSAVRILTGLNALCGMDECTRCSSAVSTEIHVKCRQTTKSVYVVSTFRYTKSLRLLHRKKGGHRIGAPLRSSAGVCHIQPFTYCTTERRSSPIMNYYASSFIYYHLSYFSRKLWIVLLQLFGHVSCTPNEEASSTEFGC
ncbi:hypothetical protein TNCV_5059831 [Trichonephila clavipes]|nr:hypothetical protein TNCV_5059831 [Trichonephila clavipes]